MSGAVQRLTELIAQLVAQEEREFLLGDMHEMGITGWRSLREMLGFLCRRQLQPWSSWQPWIAAFLLALPFSFLLMGFSVAISMGCRQLFILGTSYEPGFFCRLLCQIVLLFLCSWTGGFVLRRLAPRVFWISSLCCLAPCLFCLSRFRMTGLSPLSLFLFLLPGIAGVFYAKRGPLPRQKRMLGVAILGTVCMSVLALTQSSWLFNWLLLWPLWSVAAGAWTQGHTVEPR